MRFLDANIFLRYLVPGDEAKARACFALFQKVKTGEEVVTTSEAVVAEVAYVLRSRAHYRLAPSEIGARLRPILALRGLKLPHKRTYLRALDLWNAHPALDFEDVLTVAHMERLGLVEVVSYDTDFDRLPDLRRVEP
ncbi:MAG: type II toxin-antitoxin system VapC family toxin [Chloroflexi bacterium]|nr:type II toxin-antitoxin system VapC family toxin [Chloroflexota bacterium]